MGEPLGLIALLDSKPIVNGSLATSLLQAVSVQVAAELERQQYEKALLESKIRAETLFGAITDAIFVHEVGKDGHVGKFLEVNDVACQKLGYSREELLGMAPMDIDASDTNVDFEPLIKKLFAGESVTFEQVHIHKDGRRIPMEINASLFDLRGKTAVISLARDISERWVQEENLREQLRRNELILQTTQDGFWVVTMDGRLIEVNDTYCHLSGYSREELLGMSVCNIEANENPDQIAAHMHKVADEGHDCFETRHLRKDGSLIDLEISVSLIEVRGERRFVAFLRDIGERRQAEESRRRYEHIVATSTDILALLDREFTYLAVNPAYLAAWQKSREEMVGRPAVEVVGEEFFETWMKPNALRCLTGKTVSFQTWYKYPAYDLRYMDFNYYPYRDSEGEVIGFAINGRNMTGRHQAETELRRAMHSLGERMKELRCLYDLSRLAESKIGSLDDFMRKAVELLPSGWQYPKITCACIVFEEQQFRTENFACSKWCLARPIVVDGKQCGEVKVCCLESVPEMGGTPFLKEEEELIEAIAGQLGRIVQQKSTERMRRVSEARFRTLFEQSSLAMQIVGVDGRTQKVNDAWARLWGVPFEALAEYNLFQDRQLIDAGVLPLIRKVFAGESVQVPELEYDRGATAEVPGQEGKLWVRTNISPLLGSDGEIREIVLVQEDISASKRMEFELSGQRERHEMAQRIAHLGHWRLDLVNNRLEWSEENFRIFGREPGAENTYETFLQIVHPDDVGFVNEAYTSHVKNGTPYNIEHRLLMPDGSVKWVNERCETWYDEDGTPLYSLGTTLDITERRQAEQALKKKEGELDTIFHYAPVIAFYKDRQGRFLRVNRLLSERLGIAEEALIGKTALDLYPPEIARSMIRDDDEVMASGRSKLGILEEVETIFGRRWVQTDKIPTFAPDGEVAGLVGFATDITDRRQAEEQLRQAQKLEAIGTLVGGIAHDFNNMLAAIKANVYLAKQQHKKNVSVEERLDNIEQAATGAAEMVRQLLAFARKEISSTSVFSFNGFLREGEKMVRTLVPENIECVIDLCHEELTVNGDANQLQQVLLNLFNNACDAVAATARPRISCSLRPFRANEEFRRRHPELGQEEFACWSVADNGCGIPEAQQEKIFEPFFTTKEVGKGTGLGLAMVFGIVRGHGGVIELESAEGEGTAFRIYLPISCEPAMPENAPRRIGVKGRGETILLADDEDSVRSSTHSVLESLGYKVLEAADGEIALQLFSKHSDEIDLLMTDVVMPKLNGPDLLLRVRELKQEMPVVLVTGYDRGKMLDEHLGLERCEAISKPYHIDELSELLRRLLDDA